MRGISPYPPADCCSTRNTLTLFSVGWLSTRLWVSDVTTRKRWERVSEKRTVDSSLPQSCSAAGLHPGPWRRRGRWPGASWSWPADLRLGASCSGTEDWDSLSCRVHPEARARAFFSQCLLSFYFLI